MKKQIKMKEVAYNFIKSKILSNEFEPGKYLEESVLCSLIGVSRTPIREAMSQLMTENFVESIPNKGVFVTIIDTKYAKELFQCRFQLEPISLELNWENYDKDKLKEFEEETKTCIENIDIIRLNELDYEFHNYLNSESNNNYFSSIMQGLSDQFQRVRTLDYYSNERVLKGAKEHLEIISFIYDGDLKTATEMLKKHIKNTEKYYFMSLIG